MLFLTQTHGHNQAMFGLFVKHWFVFLSKEVNLAQMFGFVCVCVSVLFLCCCLVVFSLHAPNFKPLQTVISLTSAINIHQLFIQLLIFIKYLQLNMHLADFSQVTTARNFKIETQILQWGIVRKNILKKKKKKVHYLSWEKLKGTNHRLQL